MEQDFVGLLGKEAFLCPPSTFAGNRLQPPWPFLSPQMQIQIVANHRRKGMKKQERNNQEMTVQTLMMGKIEGRRRRDNRGWDGWMTSPTWWRWVWASSRRWWRTGKPGVLQSMGSQSQTRLSDWTIIDLECCVNFKCTAKIICYTNTYIYTLF